jgi:hypothetical protein
VPPELLEYLQAFSGGFDAYTSERFERRTCLVEKFTISFLEAEICHVEEYRANSMYDSP